MRLVHKFVMIFIVSLLFAPNVSFSQPYEYVIVCDRYGSNWMFLPGTENCINPRTGEIRYESPTGTQSEESELASRVTDLEARMMAPPDYLTRAFKRLETEMNQLAAIANSLEDPDLVAGERFGVRVNWGTSGGENAVGFSAVAVLDDNWMNTGARLAVSGALGRSRANVGGRVGAQLTW